MPAHFVVSAKIGYFPIAAGKSIMLRLTPE